MNIPGGLQGFRNEGILSVEYFTIEPEVISNTSIRIFHPRQHLRPTSGE